MRLSSLLSIGVERGNAVCCLRVLPQHAAATYDDDVRLLPPHKALGLDNTNLA
jgi:hypothetical protein